MFAVRSCATPTVAFVAFVALLNPVAAATSGSDSASLKMLTEA